MVKIGFDNEKYLALQAEHIRQRMSQFGGKLYLEFGGKLFDDYHASRVLPGFQPDSKIRMLETIRDDVEIVIAICAGDIEKNKTRGDLGIGYDQDVLRLFLFRSFIGMYDHTKVCRAGEAAASCFNRSVFCEPSGKLCIYFRKTWNATYGNRRSRAGNIDCETV